VLYGWSSAHIWRIIFGCSAAVSIVISAIVFTRSKLKDDSGIK